MRSKYGTMKIQVLVFCLRIQYSTRIGDRSVGSVVLVKRLRSSVRCELLFVKIRALLSGVAIRAVLTGVAIRALLSGVEFVK